MTREEAIGHIKDVICENNTIKPNMVVFEQEKEALCMAIEALKAQSCEDYVSRKEVIFIVQDIDMKSDVYDALRLIKELPSVQPERAKGKWIVHKHDLIEYLECNRCHSFFQHEHLVRNSFCPNCGADMRGEQE